MTHMWGLWLVDAVVGLVAWCSVWHVHQHFQSRHLVDVFCVDDALLFQLSVIAASETGSRQIVCIVDTILDKNAIDSVMLSEVRSIESKVLDHDNTK